MTDMLTNLDTQVVVDRRVLSGYDNYLAAQRTGTPSRTRGSPSRTWRSSVAT
jgi:hypothetical protein